MFPSHTVETAPPAARPAMAASARKFGQVPPAVSLLATSPETLNGFFKLNALFETTTLAPVEREVLVMTVATRNGCHVCIAIHTEVLESQDADPTLITALRAQTPLPDSRLEALRTFVLAVMDARGEASDETLAAFVAAGFDARNALEVVLGIGTYTLITFANRMVRAAS